MEFYMIIHSINGVLLVLITGISGQKSLENEALKVFNLEQISAPCLVTKG